MVSAFIWSSFPNKQRDTFDLAVWPWQSKKCRALRVRKRCSFRSALAGQPLRRRAKRYYEGAVFQRFHRMANTRLKGQQTSDGESFSLAERVKPDCALYHRDCYLSLGFVFLQRFASRQHSQNNSHVLVLREHLRALSLVGGRLIRSYLCNLFRNQECHRLVKIAGIHFSTPFE